MVFRGCIAANILSLVVWRERIWKETSSSTLTSCPMRICAANKDSVPCRLLTLTLTFSCLMDASECSSGLHTNWVFYPLNALSHMGWRWEYCREWAPHCQNSSLSVFLSLHGAALQCFSAHAQTDWERATASLSSLEILTACITDTFAYSCELRFAFGTKDLSNATEKEFLDDILKG